MRTLILAGLVGLAGCSYDAEKSDLSFRIDNITQTEPVNHLDVTLTLADGPHVYHPTFGPQSGASIALTLSSGGQSGNYTITVDELDRSGNNFGTMTVTGPLTEAQGTTKVVTLPAAP